MSAAEIKTKPTTASVEAYLDSIKDPERRADCKKLAHLMKEITKEDPVMWGESLVGFGKTLHTYSTGRKVEWLTVGFASRKNAISLYLTSDLDRMREYLSQLGKHKRGVGCLYIKRLADIDESVLKKMMLTLV